MEMIKLPIIIAEGLDVQFFSTKKDAEIFVEAIDVKDDVYRCFDATGRVLTLKTKQNKVWIEEEKTVAEDKLKALLAEHFACVKKMPKEKFMEMPLTELIRLGQQ